MLDQLKPARLWYASTRLHRRGWGRTAKLLKAVNFAMYKCLLPGEADVSADVILEHYAVWTVGRGVRIFHGVTVAGSTWIGSPHRVVIGDDVSIGAGAIVVGGPARTIR